MVICKQMAFAVHCNLAMATCVSKGRSMSVYWISVEDNLGVQIAEMLANGFTAAKR